MAFHPLATITVDGDPGEIRVNVRGELDASNAADFAELVERFISSERLVINCERLTFIDSSGLGVLLRVAAARRSIGACVLRQPSAELRRLLELTGVTECFDLAFDERLTPI